MFPQFSLSPTALSDVLLLVGNTIRLISLRDADQFLINSISVRVTLGKNDFLAFSALKRCFRCFPWPNCTLTCSPVRGEYNQANFIQGCLLVFDKFNFSPGDPG